MSIAELDEDAVIFDGEKTCKTCGEIKSRTEFYKHKTNTDGLFNDCKKCLLLKRREKYAKRKDVDCSHLDRVQKFVQGYLDPSELDDDEVTGSFIRDDRGVPVRTPELREKFHAKFTKELSRRVNDFIRKKTPRAIEVVFEIADNDLYEAADRFRAATWLAERVIGKTPDVLITGTTDAPYQSILEGITTSSREEYRQTAIESSEPSGIYSDGGRSGIIDVEATEIEENASFVEGSEDADGESVSENSTDQESDADDSSDNEFDESAHQRAERIAKERQERIEKAKRIKKAKQRRYAARAVGATSLSEQPWLIDFKPIQGTTKYKLKLIPPDAQTPALVDRWLATQPWRVDEATIERRRAEAAKAQEATAAKLAAKINELTGSQSS